MSIIIGDYLCGVVGFWVENGWIVYLVEEIIIVVNLCDMFCGIVVVGSDVDLCLYLFIGLILFECMMVVGE